MSYTNFSWWRRQQDVIAQGSLTNSKDPRSHVYGVYPTHVKSAQGCLLIDADGREYVDYICGLGTNLLGYGNDDLKAAIDKWKAHGFSHSLPTTQEVATAERLCAAVPHFQSIKFLNSGSEACSAALIMARAFTKRSVILTDGYHGHGAEFTSLTPPGYGCPESKHIYKYDDLLSLENVAAVIIEPIITDCSRERIEWLRDLYERCQKHGALLIFDEVICGFRHPRFTMARHYGVKCDLTILGKAMSGGMSVSAVCGRKDILDGDYFVSTTTGGETLGLACVEATIDVLERGKYKLDDLWKRGGEFVEKFNETAMGVVSIKGYNTRGVICGGELEKALFFQEMAKAGILFGPSWFYNFPLMDYDETTLSAVRDVCSRIKVGTVKLEGEMPRKPYATKVREKND